MPQLKVLWFLPQLTADNPDHLEMIIFFVPLYCWWLPNHSLFPDSFLKLWPAGHIYPISTRHLHTPSSVFAPYSLTSSCPWKGYSLWACRPLYIMLSLPATPAFLDYLENSRQKHLPCQNKSPNDCGMFCSHALSFFARDHMFLTHAALWVWILEWKGMRSKIIDNPEQKCTMNQR